MADELEEVVYQDGHFYPVKSSQFDIQRDRALLAEGNHFFCQGHLSAVDINEQSRNRKYCSECYSAIKETSSA